MINHLTTKTGGLTVLPTIYRQRPFGIGYTLDLQTNRPTENLVVGPTDGENPSLGSEVESENGNQEEILILNGFAMGEMEGKQGQGPIRYFAAYN